MARPPRVPGKNHQHLCFDLDAKSSDGAQIQHGLSLLQSIRQPYWPFLPPSLCIALLPRDCLVRGSLKLYP